MNNETIIKMLEAAALDGNTNWVLVNLMLEAAKKLRGWEEHTVARGKAFGRIADMNALYAEACCKFAEAKDEQEYQAALDHYHKILTPVKKDLTK